MSGQVRYYRSTVSIFIARYVSAALLFKALSTSTPTPLDDSRHFKQATIAWKNVPYRYAKVCGKYVIPARRFKALLKRALRRIRVSRNCEHVRYHRSTISGIVDAFVGAFGGCAAKHRYVMDETKSVKGPQAGWLAGWLVGWLASGLCSYLAR